jgi:hypothetical protein
MCNTHAVGGATTFPMFNLYYCNLGKNEAVFAYVSRLGTFGGGEKGVKKKRPNSKLKPKTNPHGFCCSCDAILASEYCAAYFTHVCVICAQS